ncbi:MAG: class I SAM-dependent methyltransferase [Verrucomicrobia bacterium]|nr:class I SAM-dependent methyltransferase [Verrucomicrobiota bacterium]MDA1065907.1 class I SAM-dependent methyltransferase [Verrucomicrobiota bacterium]
MDASQKCRICNADTFLKWSSNLKEELNSEHFAITDANYGLTGAIDQCPECGFLQCSDLGEVLDFYVSLEDPRYEQGRKERALQAAALLGHLETFAPGESLLDVGAGTGILVEEALKAGFKAEGIEPSIWLHGEAAKKNLPIKRGLLSDLEKDCTFNYITLIDVIEHVEDPVTLLREVSSHLTEEGYAMVATPDCGAFFARLLGRKWWHYRIAHISYFNRKTLDLISKKTGFEIMAVKRPGWYFTLDYLWIRLLAYLPKWMRLKPMAWMKTVTIPFNLGDSLLVVMKKQKNSQTYTTD